MSDIIAMNGNSNKEIPTPSKPISTETTTQSNTSVILNSILERDQKIQRLDTFINDLKQQQQQQAEKICSNTTENELLNFVLDDYVKHLEQSITQTKDQIQSMEGVKNGLEQFLSTIPKENLTSLATFTQNIDELERNIDSLNSQLETFQTQLDSITLEGQTGGYSKYNKQYTKDKFIRLI